MFGGYFLPKMTKNPEYTGILLCYYLRDNKMQRNYLQKNASFKRIYCKFALRKY